MSTLTSEQAITALEHSSKPIEELLDDAAAIIGFSISEDAHELNTKLSSTTNVDSARFREQWLLRWSIKILNQAVNVKQPSDEYRRKLLSGEKTWRFLNHLLVSIPKNSSRAIILERNFCHTFSECLATVAELADSKLSAGDNELLSKDRTDLDNDRPTKKRKISHDETVSQHGKEAASFSVLVNTLHTARQIAEALSVVDEGDASHRRHLPPNWASNIDQAATFVARLMRAVSLVTAKYREQAHSEGGDPADILGLVERWIELWQASATAAQNQRKQNPSLAFVNHALIPVLDFLGTLSNNNIRPVSQVLERQIATACVLPLRSVFQKQSAGTWDSAGLWGFSRTEPQYEAIQKVMETLTSNMGEAATGFRAAAGEKRMVTLMSIASRIIPPSDVVRRRADRPWIEALFLCLCLLLSEPDSTNESLHNGSAVSASVISAYARLPLPIFTSSTCLDALQATGIEPSTRFWHFYVQHVLYGNKTNISVRTLVKLVSLNASAFVPEHQDHTPGLSKTFCDVLANNLGSDEQSLQLALSGILAPIWEEFGKKRLMNSLIEFWQSNLLDTFHTRSSSATVNPPASLWDHPDLLEIFYRVCQHHAPPSLCVNMLGVVMKDIARLADIVGPTHDIFARITILEPMLKSLGKSSTVQQTLNDQEKPVHDLMYKALLRSTDYQGHRWRLWKMLELFTQLSPSTFNSKNTLKLEIPWIQFSSAAIRGLELQSIQAKSQYMELSQSFSYVVSLSENSGGSESIFIEIMARLNELMEVCCRHSMSSKGALEFWNGMVDTMNSASKLLSACLARLARSSTTWFSSRIVHEDFFTNLAVLSLGQHDAQHSADLATAAEAMLAETVTSVKMDLTKTYCDALSRDAAMNSIPTLLHSVAQEMASQHQPHEFFKTLFETMKKIHPASHANFNDYLSLVTEILTSHPSSAVPALDVASFIQVLQRSTSGATLEQVAAAYESIQLSVRLIISQSSTTPPSGKTGLPWEELLVRTKEHLIGVEASEAFEVLNSYTGYLSIAVTRIVREINTTNISKRGCKAIDKIKARHADVVLKQCKIHAQESTDMTNFWSILVLLDSLVPAQIDKTFNRKLQKGLQKVVQAALTADTGHPEGTTSAQQARIIAKLWNILRRYVRSTKSRPTPDFPHASFARIIGQEETKNTLMLRAQLATSHPSRTSIASLASVLHLSKTEAQPQDPESVSSAEPKQFLSIAANIRSLVLDDSLDAETIKALGNIACLQTAVDETSPASLIVRLELSKMVLEKHTSIVNQHVIDSTLTSIMALASAASKAITTTDSADIRPEYIFDRLCTILSILLIRYRRRLTGRHHLFLPAVQNLLKSLFYHPSRKHMTTSSSSKIAYLASLPPWLNPTTHTSMWILPPASATKFSRVLSQLCDPSASSARHVSKRSSSANDNLVDEVKSLRREVSRHTQYVLQTYCRVMLDGYIAPDVKEKLLPGLYAVMNAMDVEVMRALNAAMDASQRAIWKDLYSDWKTYGRWNQR